MSTTESRTEANMCGIAGMIGQRTGDETAPLQILAHRGPDDAGWIAHGAHPHPQPLSQGARGDRARFHSVLLHRRLSILDLSAAGHQPMASQAGGYTIVFNGEIYNYRELRDELRTLGCEFHSETDTEVLLQAYSHWGAACLPRLIGMFAFAIEDLYRGTLFLARDFFGIKPLYYARALTPHPSPL